ncbi:ring finger domain-containing protein [Hirsutella rhossiliensis]
MATNSSTSAEDNPSSALPRFIIIGTGALVVSLVALFLILRYCIGSPTTQQDADDDAEAVGAPRDIKKLDAVASTKTYGKLKSDIQDFANPPRYYTSTIVCAICLENLQDVDVIRQLCCGHIFHAECIQKWFLKQHSICPLCKSCFMSGAHTVN